LRLQSGSQIEVYRETVDWPGVQKYTFNCTNPSIQMLTFTYVYLNPGVPHSNAQACCAFHCPRSLQHFVSTVSRTCEHPDLYLIRDMKAVSTELLGGACVKARMLLNIAVDKKETILELE
jgi:hypothetical protein